MSSKQQARNRVLPPETAEEATHRGETVAASSSAKVSAHAGSRTLQPETAPFPWGLVWVGVVVVVLFVLRRYLRAMFPVLLLFSVFLPLLWYLWRQYTYRDLWDVYRDYDELIKLLHSKGLYTYGSSVNQSMRHIMAARDKAEGLRLVLQRADLPGQRARIESLEKQLSDTADAEKRALLMQTITDAKKTLDGYRRTEAFLSRYAEGKKYLAEQFRALRLKLEVPVFDERSAGRSQVDEIDEMIEQLRRLDCTYESVDGRGAAQPHSQD